MVLGINANHSSYCDINSVRIEGNTKVCHSENSFIDLLNNATGTSSETAQQYLQERFPSIKYHTLDASQIPYWEKDRLDFPFSEMFKDSINVGKLAQWKPSTPYSNGFEPHVQADRRKIPDGSYAVFIHPKTQEKMDSDPAYAILIAQKVENHFNKTIRINEAMLPGCTEGMSQAVSINEDGEIGSQVSITRSVNDPDVQILGIKPNESDAPTKPGRSFEYAEHQTGIFAQGSYQYALGIGAWSNRKKE